MRIHSLLNKDSPAKAFRTYPSRRTSSLELRNLLGAFPTRLLIISDSVENIIPIQAGKESISALPAACATRAIRCDAAAVRGFVGVAG